MYILKNVKNTHGGVLLLVKLQALACNFTKSNTTPWMFFSFLDFANDTTSRNASHLLCLIFRTVELLLKYGADPLKTEKQGFLPIHYAAVNGHKLTIEMVGF